MNALSLFNGISGLHCALDRTGIEANTVYYSEIDKYANQVTQHHYPEDVALGDVTKWQEWDLDWSSIDLVTAGFPCFTANSLILTSGGYKEISKICLGDLVLTHTNTWKPVVTLFEKENFIWEIKAQGLVKTGTTEEHPFLISRKSRAYDPKTRSSVRTFSKPEWVEIKDIKRGDFICYPKIKEQENPLGLSEDDCYILGRYIADGHTAKHNRSEVGRTADRFWNLILSVGSHKIPKIETKHHLHQHSQGAHRMVFSNKRLVQLAEEHCGCGAINKEISPTLLKLPKGLLKRLVDGILDGDGCVKNGVHRLTSISLRLVNSLNLAIMKLYGVVGSISYTKRPETTVIQGRTVNQKDTYTIQFSKVVRKQVNFSEIEDYFIAPVSSVEKTDEFQPVYNIEVDVDNSYTVNNCIVHNCQAWSVAGAQQGDKDPRGMLFWTTLDIIKKVLHHNPSAKFLMENVKMKKDFEEYITHHTTEALGYVEKTLINSALVSAQNRNRYYWTNFPVTQPEDKGILLKDVLEGGMQAQGGAIRGRYNADGTTSQKLECNGLEKTNTLTTVQKDNVVIYRPCELRENSKPSKDNLHHIADATDIKGMDCIKRVYGQDSKAPTLTTMGGGHREPKVLCSDVLYRKLTPLECERLQTFPDGYTAMVSNTQRYKSLGNSWTIDVIAHILRCMA